MVRKWQARKFGPICVMRHWSRSVQLKESLDGFQILKPADKKKFPYSGIAAGGKQPAPPRGGQKWWRWTWWASYLCRQREDWTMLLGTGRSWCPTTGGMQLGSAARMSWSHTPPLGITHPDYWETKESCSSDALLFSVFFEWILFLKYFSFFPREAHFVGLLFFYRTWREQLCWMKRLHVIFLYLFVYLLFFLVFHVGLMSRSE